jgi:hypothetical protein
MVEPVHHVHRPDRPSGTHPARPGNPVDPLRQTHEVDHRQPEGRWAGDLSVPGVASVHLPQRPSASVREPQRPDRWNRWPGRAAALPLRVLEEALVAVES